MNLKSNDLFKMAGTEATFSYVVVLATALGRIGFRALGQGVARIRVEPFNPTAADTLASSFKSADGWKQPGSQFRFSLECEEDGCVPEGKGFLARLEVALRALLDSTEVAEYRLNPEFAETWTAELANRVLKDSLLARAKKLGVKGASIRWKAETLCARCTAAEQAS